MVAVEEENGLLIAGGGLSGGGSGRGSTSTWWWWPRKQNRGSKITERVLKCQRERDVREVVAREGKRALRMVRERALRMAKEGERALRRGKKKKKRQWQGRVSEQRAREGGREGTLKKGDTNTIVSGNRVCMWDTNAVPTNNPVRILL